MAKHHKQIQYVSANTLIVGIDIGQAVHSLCQDDVRRSADRRIKTLQ